VHARTRRAPHKVPPPPQAVASRESEPDPSPPQLRPLAHRVTNTRPDQPTQAALEDLGLSDPITEPDPDLCVETEHHLPDPADPVYQLYKINCPCPNNTQILVRCLNNTLTKRVALWYKYKGSAVNHALVFASALLWGWWTAGTLHVWGRVWDFSYRLEPIQLHVYGVGIHWEEWT
jgi:hypothetical protein